ncbi:hypothetical protein AO364_0590 [Moraxella catarrhalis]|nr:hypothetical protein AO364_0590 [Moraxella catarrhalis]
MLDEMFWFAEFLAVYQLPALGDAWRASILTVFGHLDFVGAVLSPPPSAVVADGQMVASSHQHILMPIW